MPTPNSLQKLDYIYQHFQDNEKIHESHPNLVGFDTDYTLYSHINNDIEYVFFEDVIDTVKSKITPHVTKIATQEHNTNNKIKF